MRGVMGSRLGAAKPPGVVWRYVVLLAARGCMKLYVFKWQRKQLCIRILEVCFKQDQRQQQRAAIRCSLRCCRVEPQRRRVEPQRRRAWRCAMATLYNTAKVLEQQLITRFWPWQSGYLDIPICDIIGAIYLFTWSILFLCNHSKQYIWFFSRIFSCPTLNYMLKTNC